MKKVITAAMLMSVILCVTNAAQAGVSTTHGKSPVEKESASKKQQYPLRGYNRLCPKWPEICILR